jgi:hypothetical protein
MAQFVIEFGSPTLGPVLDGLLSLIGCPHALETSFPSGGGATTPATKRALDAIPQQFADRRIASVTFRTGTAGVRYGLILEPRFNGRDLTVWMGTIELTTNDWRPYWDKLLQFDGLVFICVGNEEGVEMTDQSLTVASFPWDEWPVVIAALRHPGGKQEDWVIRERASATS